jgi:hypothetical protein
MELHLHQKRGNGTWLEIQEQQGQQEHMTHLLQQAPEGVAQVVRSLQLTLLSEHGR